MTENKTIPLPGAYIARIKDELKDGADAFLASYENEPLRGLRINPLKTGEELGSEITKDLRNIPWESRGYYYNISEQPFGRSPLQSAGAYYIQEPSAMLPVSLLDVHPGLAVLDLCAAPGGKSTQIAAYLAGDGLLIANDPVPSRASVLSSNIERMGIRNALVTCHDPKDLALRFPSSFDRILVDAPCSGEGMFRKEPETRGEWSVENVMRCAERQSEILDAAAVMLRPGGKLVYSTCTFSEAEDEEQVRCFLSKHPDFTGVSILEIDGMRCGVGVMSCCARIWPQDGFGEGHFATVFQREGELRFEDTGFTGRMESSLSNKERSMLTPYKVFIEDTFPNGLLKEELLTEERLFVFKDRLCLMPKSGIPHLSGLRVMRAGLELGEFKKDRFVPSHALALAADPSDVMREAPLSDEEALQYLNGMTLPADKIKSPAGAQAGWTLVTVSGISLGWARSSGSLLKNHYPKGLRIYQ